MTSANAQDWLGTVIARKSIGGFVFVQHVYSRLSERGQHSHPWLHLSIVQRGQYERTLGRSASHYRSGDVTLLTTDERHADSYVPGTKCLLSLAKIRIVRNSAQLIEQSHFIGGIALKNEDPRGPK